MQRVLSHYPILLIMILGGALRFYNLGVIPGETFDEIFYPVNGLNYLSGEKFYSVHPPLGTYLISLGIYLYYLMPWTDTLASTAFEIANLDPISYRWLNAAAGSALILVAYKLSVQLLNKKGFALLVALFFCLDGSLLVDSRFGLINIYLSLFGFIAMLFTVKAFKSKNHQQKNIAWALIFLGLTVSVKWNGLGFWGVCLVGMMLIFLLSKINSSMQQKTGLFDGEGRINSLLLWALLVVPFLVYALVWIPDFFFMDQFSYFEKHQQMVAFHSNSIEGNPHPYRSDWYTWPVMIKPIGYYFAAHDVLLPDGAKQTIFTAVHLFPNPALYLFSFLAILVMTLTWFIRAYEAIVTKIYEPEFLVISFVLIGFYANFLPWALVSRSVFLYHYQPASGFAFLALGFVLYKASQRQEKTFEILYRGVLISIIAAAIYWLPFQLGLDIERERFYQMMWSQSWI
jgi:dolichyl-phosphate-mannose-protein mannosyltransferase